MTLSVSINHQISVLFCREFTKSLSLDKNNHGQVGVVIGVASL